jgi:hypothetical protein
MSSNIAVPHDAVFAELTLNAVSDYFGHMST